MDTLRKFIETLSSFVPPSLRVLFICIIAIVALLIFSVSSFPSENLVGSYATLALCGLLALIGLVSMFMTPYSLFGSRCDVFIAAPMAAQAERNQPNIRDTLEHIAQSLTQQDPKLKVFYAWRGIEHIDEFDLPGRSLRENAKKLRASRHFILIYEDQVVSSVLTEAGMALGYGVDSVWFVRKGCKLPFLMREGVAASNSTALPKIRLYEYENQADLLKMIKKYGLSLFD